MKAKLKLFFDECVGSPRLIHYLEVFYTDIDGQCEAEFSRLQEKFISGEDDPSWLGKLRDEGGWIVITKDHGKSGGPKLPAICPKLGVTHVALHGGLKSSTVEEMKQAFADVWKALKLAPELPAGTKIKMRYATVNPGRAALYVGNKELKPS